MYRSPQVHDYEHHISAEEGTWFRLAERSGLTELRRVGIASQIDAALISAFVERWHPETNTFHMPFAEMTICLHDVMQILRVRIHGRSCNSPMTDDQIYAALADAMGQEADDMKACYSSGGIHFGALNARLEVLFDAPVRNESHIATLYLLLLLGSTVLVDRSTKGVKVQYAALVLNHDRTWDIAWGAGILALVYRNLGSASRVDTATIGSCGILLRVRSCL